MEGNGEHGTALPSSASEDGSASRAERVRAAVKILGGNRQAVRKTGVPLSTLGGYMAGGEMKLSNVVALAQAAALRLEWLATGEGPMRAGEVATATAKPAEGAPWPPPGYVALPRLEARAAAGATGNISSDRLVDYMLFSKDFLGSALHRRHEALALIEATGDSMDPTIRDGELLLVDTDAVTIQSGRVYVIAVDDGLIVKRVVRRVDGSLLIKSDNPAYEPEVMRPGANAPARIAGQVVWQGGPVRT